MGLNHNEAISADVTFSVILLSAVYMPNLSYQLLFCRYSF